MQRLRAGFYLHRCRPGVLSGTRLFDSKTLQALPYGKEKRSGGFRRRLSIGSCTGYACDLLGLWPADDCTIRAARRSTGVLPRLLSGAQRQQRRCRRWTRARTILRSRALLRSLDRHFNLLTNLTQNRRIEGFHPMKAPTGVLRLIPP